MAHQTPLLSLPLDLESKSIRRKTDAKYLEEFNTLENMSKQKIWKDNYYIKNALYNFLQNVCKL